MLKGSSFEKSLDCLRQKNVIICNNANKSMQLESQKSACQKMMDQQCRLVQSLQHQTEYPYRYFREYGSMLRIGFFIMVGINQA